MPIATERRNSLTMNDTARSKYLKLCDASSALWRNFFVRSVVLIILGIVSALLILPLFLCLIEWSYGLSGRKFIELDHSSLPYIYTAVFGVVVTLMTVVVTVNATQEENRKQATLKILLEARVSEYFQKTQDLVIEYFPSNETDCLKKLRDLSDSEDEREQKAVAAVFEVLNYYEFIAAGIRQRNLDKKMLKNTIRRILCRLVFDMRDIIRDIRVNQKRTKSYQHLVAIYWEWVDKTHKDEFDGSMGDDNQFFDC